jgi:hypothetical protein
VVPDGIYRLELYLTDGVSEFTWDPAASGLGNGTGTIPSSFDIYRNEFWKMNYHLDQTGLVRFQVTPQGEPAFNVIDLQPYGAGDHSISWDGRRPDGSIVSGSTAMYFAAPVNLRANAVVVRTDPPQITGTGVAPNVEVKSDPYFITHSYEQISTMTFRLDQDATVTFKLLPPGIYDPSDASAIALIDNELRQATDGGGAPIDHAVQWFGYDAADPNAILVSDEGAYTFTIEATSAATGLTSLYRGVLQTRQ